MMHNRQSKCGLAWGGVIAAPKPRTSPVVIFATAVPAARRGHDRPPAARPSFSWRGERR